MGGQGGEKTGGEFEGKEVGQMEAHWAQGQKQGAAPPAGHTSAARAAAPLLGDLEWAGQGWAPQPHTADVAGLQRMLGQ